MNIFNENGMFSRFFGKIGDILILNVLFLICSLPVVTFGISLTSMQYAFLRKIQYPDSSPARDFFRSFRRNFLQATLAWLLVIAFAFVVLVDINMFRPGGVRPFTPMYYLFLMIGVIGIFTALYLFPVIAAFENTLLNLCVQSFFLAAKNILWTLLIAAVTFLPLYFTLTDPQLLLATFIVWLLFGFGFLGWVNSFIYYHVFRPWLPAPESIEDAPPESLSPENPPLKDTLPEDTQGQP